MKLPNDFTPAIDTVIVKQLVGFLWPSSSIPGRGFPCERAGFAVSQVSPIVEKYLFKTIEHRWLIRTFVSSLKKFWYVSV